AHPVEEEAIRIGGLDLDILFHYGRRAARFDGCGALRALVGHAGFEARRCVRMGQGHGGATLAEGLRRVMRGLTRAPIFLRIRCAALTGTGGTAMVRLLSAALMLIAGALPAA